ncbi:MAG: TonB-dependent receptor [Woeseia sp.]
MTQSNERRNYSKRRKSAPMLRPLAAAVLTALYPAGSSMAQEAGDGAEEARIEEVVVTGSRIRKDTFSSAAPMDVVLTESAAVRGISDVATLLQTTTVAAGSPQVTSAISSVNVVNGGLGTSTLSLRGLGANRTLVLLNGRRAGPSGVQGSVSSFDLNTIPLAAIERVELLKDGASSIYGSDAVAGVVNIITRKDEGGEFGAFYSQPNQTGGEQLRLNGSWGKKTDRGYFRATADYNQQEILMRGQRDFFKCNENFVFEQGTGNRADLIDPRTNDYYCDGLPWGHVWVYDYATDVGDGTTNAGPPVFLMQYDFDGALAANGVSPLAPTGGNANWMTAPAGWYPVSQGDRLTESLTDTDHPLHDRATLVPKAEVATVLLEGEYDVTDGTTAYTEVLLSRRKTTDVGFRQVWSYVYNYDSADLGWGSDPFSAGWTGAQWLSPLAMTDHADSRVEVDYKRFVAGLRGEMDTVLPGWNWDVSFQYSRSDGEYEDQQILTDALEMPFWRTGSCEGQVSPVSNRPCVDIQWFDPDFLAGNISKPIRDFLFDTETGTTKYTQWSAEAFMSGDVMELPAGTAAVAVGLHYQQDEILDTPGPITLSGNAWGASSAGITAGEDTTMAVFGEISVPILADKPLVEHLEFTGSARYTDVDSYGSDTTYKAGLNWGITDSFRFRSTFGTSFRTPALYELYLASQTSFPLSARDSDPCINWGDKLARGDISQRTADNCAADGLEPDHLFTVSPTVVTGGGLGVLKAETSEALTAGFVWQPAFADLSVSVDYFDIEVKDEVDVIGARNIVVGCYESEFFPDEPLCDLFDRSAPTDPLPNAITEIRDSYINISRQHNRGIDLAIRYDRELPGLGTLTVDTQHTFQLEDTLGLFNATEEDRSGEAGHPDWVGNLNLTLNRDLWSFFWGINYIGSTDNYASFGRSTAVYYESQTVDIDLKAESVIYHSLSVSRDFESGYTARLGVSNVLDERPPRMTDYGTGSEVSVLGQVAFYSQYDWLGRRYFLNVTKTF